MNKINRTLPEAVTFTPVVKIVQVPPVRDVVIRTSNSSGLMDHNGYYEVSKPLQQAAVC